MFSFHDVLAFSFLKGFGHNSIKQKFKFLKLIPFGIFVHFDKVSRFFWNKYCVYGPNCFYLSTENCNQTSLTYYASLTYEVSKDSRMKIIFSGYKEKGNSFQSLCITLKKNVRAVYP